MSALKSCGIERDSLRVIQSPNMGQWKEEQRILFFDIVVARD